MGIKYGWTFGLGFLALVVYGIAWWVWHLLEKQS